MIEGLGQSVPLPDQTTAEKPKDVVEAARQFESLLIAQMLKSMREAGGSSGWLGTGEDSTADSAMQMAEEQLAAALSAQGGLGLAKMVANGLTAQQAKLTERTEKAE